MAEFYNNQPEEGVAENVEGGQFEYGNKEKQDDLISSEFEDKVMVSDQPQEEEEKNHHNSFASSNEEEYYEAGEDKPIKEKLPTEGTGEGEYDTRVPVENSYNDVDEEAVEKMKEKLQAFGGDIVTGDDAERPPPTSTEVAEEESTVEEAQQPEQKGFLDKIKDKIPGFNSKPNTATTTPYEEEKEETIE